MEIDSRSNKTNEVCQYINDELFNVVDNLSVLELGPMDGWFTKKLSNKTKDITCVELEKRACDVLKSKFPTLTIINEDFNKHIRQKHSYDAVVALGVTYHLTSPIDFLENIVNNINPKYIIIDVKFIKNDIVAQFEKSNNSGMRQVNSNWKSSDHVIVPSIKFITNVLSQLGYQIIKRLDLIPGKWEMWQPGIFKDGFYVAIFERM